jgi:predicted amidohydrolase
MQIIVSIAQMNIRLGNPQANAAKAEAWIREAAAAGSSLIILPELWTTGYDLSHGKSHIPENRLISARLQELARQHHIIVAGSMLTQRGDKLFNSLSVITPEKTFLPYDKIHLFHLMQETRYLSPGQKTKCVKLPWGRTGLAICYDLRFPELFRQYAAQQAKLIILPAEWPRVRIDQWETLLKSRAIENQCFVAAANCVGETGSELFGGRSAVIGPDGKVIAAAGERETLFSTELDFDQVDTLRKTFPVLKDRRLDIFG